MTARLRVVHAGPFVSFQDAGRPGNMRFGVARSGPMDRLSHAAANRVLGLDAGSTAVEVSPGGLGLRCEQGELTVSVAGGGFSGSWQVRTLRPGDDLTVSARGWGSWAYVAFLGEVEATRWLGHTATHSMAGFGGGALESGDVVVVHTPRGDAERDGEIPRPAFAEPREAVRVVLGPQERHFGNDVLDRFVSERFTLSAAYDRMGVQLDGAKLPPSQALSIPSEPVVRGSVQVTGDGTPTVLLADHQTTGGYPKIATLVSCEVDRFTQLRSGDHVRFLPITADEAVAAVRDHAEQVTSYLEAIAAPGRTLAHRLMRENLIAGVHLTD